MSGVVEIATAAQLAEVVASHEATVVDFWAAWCEPCGDMNRVFDEVAAGVRAGPGAAAVAFARVDAEVHDAVAAAYGVEAVPYFLFLRRGGERVDAVEGADAPALVDRVGALVATAASSGGGAGGGAVASLEERLRKLTRAAPVMLFMKGTPQEPKCGFSARMVALLNGLGVAFGSFDILGDPEVRDGLKKLSNWPTYPQLYAGGALVGGLDVATELAEAGELAGVLGAANKAAGSLEARLRALISQAPVVLFMKGTPQEPKCGFSARMVALLQKAGGAGFAFATFDILSDAEVRDGLKRLSNWPTYPQLYVGGRLVGGLDVATELDEGGELAPLLQPKS